MIQEVFKKYLRKTTVQKGIVSQTIKQTLLKLINPDSGLKCSYQNEKNNPNQKQFEDPMFCDRCNP